MALIRDWQKLGLSLGLCSCMLGTAVGTIEGAIAESESDRLQLSSEQVPTPDRFSEPVRLEYGTTTGGRVSSRSLRHQGRRFEIHQFDGEEGQLIRIGLLGGDESTRSPEQVQFGSLLVSPVLVLVDPNGNIIAQQPDSSDAASAIVRMTLPTTGTYSIYVTSNLIGVGGRYTITLQQLRQDGSNAVE